MSGSVKQAMKGGLKTPNSRATAVTDIPLPSILRISRGKQGSDTRTVVEKGQYVLKGQALTESANYSYPPVHASSSGTVLNICSTHIDIETDGLDQTANRLLSCIDCTNLTGLTQLAHNAGLRGHGGAGFPLAEKLSSLKQNPHLLMVNAAECDPAISCDHALIISRPTQVSEAMVTIATACGVNNIVIGIEDNMPNAAQLLRKSLAQLNTDISSSVISLPAKYPTGAERVLYELCTGQQIDNTRYLSEIGVLSMNIASCYALGQTAKTGLPCTSRITTINTLDGATHNVNTRLGTQLVDILQSLQSSATTPALYHATLGGKMMPLAISFDFSISQVCNCITIEQSANTDTVIQPCIRCGDCVDVCPVQLMPQELHIHSNRFNLSALEQFGLDNCLECRCCDEVCPSKIPLTKQFRLAKQQKAQALHEQQQAIAAKVRYEKRQNRLALTELSGRKKRLKRKPVLQSGKELIAQALQRKRNANTNNKDSGS